MKKPYKLCGCWLAMYDGKLSPCFNCKGAAQIWFDTCVKEGRWIP